MTEMIGYLGPPGTFTEEAATQMPSSAGAQLVPLGSVEAVLEAVRAGEVMAGVVPIENSLEGPVTTTLDSLANGHQPLRIVEEWAIAVEFALLGLPGTGLADIRQVATIPIAAAQCRNWLNRELPGVGVLATVSTAAAAANLRGAAPVSYQAAISPAVAARHYDLQVLAANIGDNPDATTRFVMVRQPGPLPVPTGADKTTLVLFIHKDHAGALLEILTEFAIRGVNLTRIESRPTRRQLGDYYFSVDCEGHVANARVGQALTGLRRVCADVRFVGSYARHDGKSPHVRRGTTDSDFANAQAWLERIRAGE